MPLLLQGADDDFPRVEHLWVDQGYTGSGKTWIEQNLGCWVEVVRHPPHPRGQWVPHGDLARIETDWFSWQRLPPGPKAFRGVLPRRWVVERSFGWLIRFRRLAKDYERLASTLAGMHLAVFAVIMLARLAKWPNSS